MMIISVFFGVISGIETHPEKITKVNRQMVNVLDYCDIISCP